MAATARISTRVVLVAVAVLSLYPVKEGRIDLELCVLEPRDVLRLVLRLRVAVEALLLEVLRGIEKFP